MSLVGMKYSSTGMPRSRSDPPVWPGCSGASAAVIRFNTFSCAMMLSGCSGSAMAVPALTERSGAALRGSAGSPDNAALPPT